MYVYIYMCVCLCLYTFMQEAVRVAAKEQELLDKLEGEKKRKKDEISRKQVGLRWSYGVHTHYLC